MPLQTPSFAMRLPSAWRIPRARLTAADAAVFLLVIGVFTLIAASTSRRRPTRG